MVNSLNLWDEYSYYLLDHQKNTTSIWSGPDNETTFNKVQKNKDISTYSIDDFRYVRNSKEFRSAEFDNSTPIKILYAGCSLTEGVGLPMDHTWCGFINDKISKQLNRPVQMFNIGLGGFSTSSIVRFTKITIDSGFTPDLVLFLLPSVVRSEHLHLTKYGLEVVNFIPSFTPDDPEQRSFFKRIQNCSSIHDSIRSFFSDLIFIDTYLGAKGIPYYFGIWDNCEVELSKTDVISLMEAIKSHSPTQVREKFIDSSMHFDHNHFMLNGFLKPFKYNFARDGQHFGPNSHFNFSNDFYSKLLNKSSFDTLINTWKTLNK